MARVLSHVLLVEDDPDIRSLAALALRRIGGFEVEECASGSEALSVARVFRPDVVLLDVMMPTMDGPSVLRALRQLPETADTPVIFLTARVQPRDVASYRSLGCLDVIVKPFVPSALPHLVRAAWDRCAEAPPAPAIQPIEDFATLRRDYLEELPDRLAALERAAQDARLPPHERTAIETLAAVAHRLAGSAAIYGLPLVSQAAADLEEFTTVLLGDFEAVSEDDRRELHALTAGVLRTAGRQARRAPTPRKR
jgi:two-component system OmpR family response regulator